jgi:hypothetical protein
MSVNRLPPVGRIRAVHLPEGGPRVPKSLTIEYSDRSNGSKWYQLEVPFVDAMHLLALLHRQATQLIGICDQIYALAGPRLGANDHPEPPSSPDGGS